MCAIGSLPPLLLARRDPVCLGVEAAREGERVGSAQLPLETWGRKTQRGSLWLGQSSSFRHLPHFPLPWRLPRKVCGLLRTKLRLKKPLGSPASRNVSLGRGVKVTELKPRDMPPGKWRVESGEELKSSGPWDGEG